jgi:hypothetical protein
VLQRALGDQLARGIGGEQGGEAPAGALVRAGIGRDPRLEIGAEVARVRESGQSGEYSRRQRQRLTCSDNWGLRRLPGSPS